ncbi:MAG: hypothetical protein KF850_18815 [Labilithrix sp.]|nr:hypothetical protein [Labilithrix sp.]
MRSLPELASEILARTGGRNSVSWDGIRHVCRLLLADADYNCAAADSKDRTISSDSEVAVDVVVGRLAEVENVYRECERAWSDFQQAERPLGAVDVWAAIDAKFCAAIERCTQTLETLRRKHYEAK